MKRLMISGLLFSVVSVQVVELCCGQRGSLNNNELASRALRIKDQAEGAAVLLTKEQLELEQRQLALDQKILDKRAVDISNKLRGDLVKLYEEAGRGDMAGSGQHRRFIPAAGEQQPSSMPTSQSRAIRQGQGFVPVSRQQQQPSSMPTRQPRTSRQEQGAAPFFIQR